MLPPEWMIVGLGNPGAEYSGTRHNIGFDIVEALADRHRIKLKERKHRAVFGIGPVGDATAILVKPMTFMNLSGQAVIVLAKTYNIIPGRIVVISDDLDLDVGRIRIRPKGGAGGHNGHKSIIQSLATEEYPRLKIGIGKGEDETIDHVLSKFHPDERPDIEKTRRKACDAIESIIANGVLAAMNEFNAG